MDEEDGKEVKRRSLDLPTPSKEKYVAKRARRSSIALSGPCGGGGGASVEKRRTFHGKQRKPDHDKKKSQRKTSRFLMIERKIDPLNLMSISQKAGNNSPKVDSPQIGDRGSNFDPDNLRPVDLSDPLKLNNLDDNLLAVKVNSHKRKRKRRRRRTYSENDKDVTALLESIGHDGDTEQSDNEESSPNKLDVPKEEEKSRSVCEKSNNVEQGRTQMDINELIVDDWTEVEQKAPTEKDDTKAAETLFHEEKISNETSDSKPEKSVIQQNDSKNYNFKFREKDRKFQYGNYSRYYGYRNPNMSDDDRIEYLKKEWFEGKDCLDIGCNVGHLTLYIARHFSPNFMTGTDIDDSLIRSARRNIQHYISLRDPQAIKQSDFPISFPICLGPLAAPLPPEKEGKSFGFPYNISFKTENYVDFEWEKMTIEPKYDFIMCLSVTKWIQLNWGDDGIRKLFKRIFLSLRPGGKFLLEPQPWKSYKKKKNLTPTTRSNFDSIKFRPDKYIQYLLSDEVGFARSEKLGIPKHKAQGFQRPIYLLTKSGVSSK